MNTARIFVGLVIALLTPPALRGSPTNQPPLPPLPEVLDRIVARARLERANDRSFATNYVFVRTRTNEVRNPKGEIKKQEIRVHTNDPAAVIARAATPRPIPGNSPRGGPDTIASGNKSSGRGRASGREELPLDHDLLQRFAFTLVGREILRSRPTLVLDFQPRSGKLPEDGLRDKFINRIAGRLWVDEGEYAVVKTQLRLTDRITVIGGLAGAVSKFAYNSERERLADGLWFSRRSNWQLEGRELFVHRLVSFHEECQDVRRRQPETDTTLATP